MEKTHLKYSFTVNALCFMFALNVKGHILIIMVCVCPGLCFMKQALEVNKLYVITGFSLQRSLCKSLLTLSEIGILNKGYYPTLMFIHLQYLFKYCIVYIDPRGGSVAEWLGARLKIHRLQV